MIVRLQLANRKLLKNPFYIVTEYNLPDSKTWNSILITEKVRMGTGDLFDPQAED